jgi:hypothetical protein
VGPSFHDKFKLSAFPQHDPPIHEHICYNLVFECVGEYSWTTYALAPFSLTPTSSYTTSFLIALHLESDGYFFIFLKRL